MDGQFESQESMLLISYEAILECSNCKKTKDLNLEKMYQCTEFKCRSIFCEQCAIDFEMQCPKPFGTSGYLPDLVCIYFYEQKYPCKNHVWGCEETFPKKEKELHEDKCDFNPGPLVLLNCPFTNCEWECNCLEISQHLIGKHDLNYAFNYDEECFILCYEPENIQNWGTPLPIYAFDKTFYQIAYYDTEFKILHFWLYLLGNRDDARAFIYRYKIIGSHEEFGHVGQVQSLQEDCKSIVDNRNTFALGILFTHRLLNENKNIEVFVKINQV